MPSDASTLIVFLVLIFLTWYIVNWAVKLLLSLFWPIITVAALIVSMNFHELLELPLSARIIEIIRKKQIT